MKPTLRLILSKFYLLLVFGHHAQSNITSATSDTTLFLRKIFRSAIIASTLLIFSTSTLLSQTVTLTSIADNDIFLGNPTRNYGRSPYMYVIQGSSIIDRSLVKFDLSGIPSNATITSATLTLVKMAGDNNAMNIATHQITNPWTEGTGGFNGKPEESNWNQRVANTNWTTAGGDFNPAAETTTSVSNNGTYTWNIPTMAQNWVTTPSNNHGVLLKSTTETGSNTQHVFSTREGPTTEWPKLVITYTTTPTITTGSISPLIFCSGSSVNVPYTKTGTFTGGNVFTAQLSDASGSFAAPIAIGTLNSTTAGTISATIPGGTPIGTSYRIRVVSNNPIVTGTNNGSNITINPQTPASPGAISGTVTQCAALAGQVYSIAPVTNATTYTWSVPTGWSITSGNGTTSITVTSGAIGQNGNISVTAGNNCGTSTARNLAVTVSYSTPVTPGVITGTTPQCPSLKGQTYSISAVPNATNYNWTVPAGWVINSGAGTTNINVTTGTSGGNITVTAGNSCGTSASNTLAVSVNPSSIDFDGIDDYIDFGNVHNQTGVFSVEAWVLQEATTSIAAIISKGDGKSGAGNQRGYHLVLNNGRLNLTWYNNAGTTILNIESTSSSINDKKWHHVAATFNGTDAILYIDGTEVKRGTPSSAPVSGTESFLVGAMYDSSAPTNPKNYFNGFIDEVRIWNVALSIQQIREMMNQEIQMNGTAVKGKIIPKDISGGCLWANLKGYYSMNDGTATDLSSNGINGVPKNICLSQDQTAPLPYVTSATGGKWNIKASWLHGNVWEIDNTATNKDWNIIKLSSNVTAKHNVKTFGLIIDSGVTFTSHSESLLENTSYLELNGTIDLQDDSQLVQTATSDLVTSATGKILRRQEGASNAFRYNYWASPVGITGATSLIDNNAATNNPNNSPFKLNMLKNESGINMQFTSAYNEANKISTYWLYTFKNGVTYWDWALLSPTESLTPGIGYTQKGTGNAGLQQQYIFEGKPNNGTILVNVNDTGGPGSVTSVSKTEFLLGNPYPSALDISKFIDDNEGVIDGYLHLWQQWAGDSHYLDEYKGGYAQVNKLGAIRASQFVGKSGATTGGSEGTLIPTKFLPVGQGFIVEIIANGTVKFNNSQRVFIKESEVNGTFVNGSVFLKSSNTKSKGTSTTSKEQTSEMQKIRLEFNSVVGPQTRREVLLGFSDVTTDGFDYGYDALCGDTSNNDFNLSLDGKSMNMQAYSPITIDKVVPLNFKSSGNNTFEIKATEFENLDSNQEIYLRDNVTGTYFDLKQNTAYRFSSAQGKFNERFEIVFQSESSANAKLLGTEESSLDGNFIYYQNTTKTLFGKKLNTPINKLSIVNMRGQTVQEYTNISQETLNNGLRLNNMASGTYVAWLKAETGQVITKKIIVN